MRRVLLGDLTAAAAHLAALPPALRPGAMTRLLQEAHAAHRYMRRMGRPHPLWGDGSLMARALAAGSGAVPRGGIDFAALAVVAATLAAWQARRR